MKMSWFYLLFFTCLVSFGSLSEARHGKSTSPSAVVVGTVYCDTCFQEDFTKNGHFIPGASVSVECKDGDSRASFRQEVKTDEHGEFRVQLPFSVSKHVKKIKRCSVKLLSSSEPYCAVASTATSSSLHLKARKEGIHIFSAGFFTFKPQNQPNLCNQKPSIESSTELDSRRTSQLSPFDNPTIFPPPLQDPTTPDLPPLNQNPLPPLNPTTPDLPPLNQNPLPPLIPFIPQLPPLPQPPPLPGLPNLPPMPGRTTGRKTTESMKSTESSDEKAVHPQIFNPTPAVFPPNPLQPPSIFPPNPFQPPPSLIPPILPQPSPPSIIPPIFPQPSPPSIFPPIFPQPPPAPLIPPLFPPIPFLTPSPPPPPPPAFPFPFPPFPFPPSPPRSPGIPPASSSAQKTSSP